MHSLLHIADGIEAIGPVWAAWAFVMERFCYWVKRHGVRSRKHALESLDNRILEVTQLEMAKARYGLTKTLSLKPKHGRTSKDKFPDCECSMFIRVTLLCRLMTRHRSRLCTARPETSAPRHLRSRTTAHRPHRDKVQPEFHQPKNIYHSGQKVYPKHADRVGKSSDLQHRGQG